MKTALEIVLEGLAGAETRVMLVGAYALQAYDVVRQTMDLDCLVIDEEESSIGNVLRKAGYEEFQRTDAFVRYAHPSVWCMDVDVMTVDRESFDKMFAHSLERPVGAQAVRVPCLLHLVALKLHAIRNNPKRELKDLGHIVELLRAHPDVISDADLRDACDRYGPVGIHEKLEGYL